MSILRRAAALLLVLPLFLGVTTAPAHAISAAIGATTPAPAPAVTEPAVPVEPPATSAPAPTGSTTPAPVVSATPTVEPSEEAPEPQPSESPVVIPGNIDGGPHVSEAPISGVVPGWTGEQEAVKPPVNGGQLIAPANPQVAIPKPSINPELRPVTVDESQKDALDRSKVSSGTNFWAVVYWIVGALLLGFFIFTLVRAILIVRKSKH